MLCSGKGTTVLTLYRAQCLGCCWKQGMTIRWRSSVTLFRAEGSESEDVKPFADIPGPKGPPYFGTYFQYKLGGININKMPETLKQWHKQYGGIVKETLLGHTIVHVFDPEAIRIIYANEDKWPRIEPMAQTTQMYREKSGMSPGLGNTNDEEWYRLRSAVQQLMMRPKGVAPLLPAVDPVALEFVAHLKHLRDHSNQVPDFATELGRWSLESSGKNCFDTRLGYLSGEGQREAVDMVEASHTVFDLTTQLGVSLPLHKYFSTPKWNQLTKAEDVLYKTLQKQLTAALERLREKMDSGKLGENEFLFLRYLMSREELSVNDVATLTLSLFTDGLPTTTPQLLFLLYLLASNPTVQDRAYHEVSSVAPHHPAPLTAQSVSNMTYIRACIKESVRMMSMVNEISRITKKDMALGGYHIPAGTPVHLNNPALYRHPDFFEQPDTFLPERWLRDWSGEKPNPFILLPFGHGPRMCAGETAVL
ncbi:probable cytochrome P450 CYP44 [Littorina saxatilis]|uniref:Cytochrome P450 n=1 Tax=Littorina saxatilis TaxID=31220 RepID=A0AAN9BBA1_9CAEN